MSGVMTGFYCPPDMVAAYETLLEAALGDLADPPVISSHEIEEDRRWRISLLFTGAPDEVLIERRIREAAALLGLDDPDIRHEALPDRDWVAESQRLLAPVRAGRFFVHGSHDRARRPGHGIALEIEAGQAFGTGQHATTKGCLLAIDRLGRSARPRRLLDLGCGSGVLGMAMARAFGRPALLADIDPIAVRVAARNARINRFPLRHGPGAAGIRTVRADGPSHRAIRAEGPYDLLIANILAGPLIAMAQDIAKSVEKGGVLILSGLLAHQERRVFAAYRDRGFRRAARIAIGDWPTLMLIRR